jgi:hypothetical protein
VRAEELVVGRARGHLPEPVQAEAAVQLLHQVRVHGVEEEHALGLHRRLPATPSLEPHQPQGVVAGRSVEGRGGEGGQRGSE